MNEQNKRTLALAGVLAALALLLAFGAASVAAREPSAIVTVCPPPGTGCDYTTIQTAIESANPGDTIRIAGGTYTENLTVTLPITLEGGYSGPPDWTRSLTLYETIVDGSGSQPVPGDWDGYAVAFPRVISDSGQYRMWYNGQSLTSPGLGWTLGLAESPDGFTWTKSGDNPILELGDEGEWDSTYRGQVAILKESGLYKMWYSGSDGGPWQTGYATSTNGLDWNIYTGNPVLPVGDGGSWDWQEADGPTVIQDGGLYKMWYHGCDDGYTACSIGYATSTNGIDWSKHPGNPVLTGTGGEWDQGWVLWPSVVKDGATYKMWYYSDRKIGLATSPDGVNWTKEATNPVLTEGWDGGAAWAQTVLLEGATYKMWLWSGGDFSTGIGYAESTDGISWTVSISNPLLTSGTPTQWGGPVVRFEGASSGSVLDGLTIQGGEAQLGGGVHADDQDITLRRCLVRDNYAFGGPDSQGAGGVVDPDGRLTIIDSWIVNNEADQGASGIRVHSGVLLLSNTLVADNYGAMAVHLNGAAQIVNATVVHNDGGVLLNTDSGGVLAITNTIIYSNQWAINLGGNGTAQVAYSDIDEDLAGIGNLNANPGFVDAAGGDYHLRGWSPCIDAGTADGAPTHDIEGTPRDAAPDMGAYEWVGFRIYLPLVVKND